jgi:ferredoxin
VFQGPLGRKECAVAYQISDECVSCGQCEPECPVEAIREGEGKYLIDAKKCTDCGTCAEVCPVEAISQG